MDCAQLRDNKLVCAWEDEDEDEDIVLAMP
jgi:hypothetical protein